MIAIFDIGKTNKKFFVFDEQYKIVLERSVQFPETSDEDGFPCDDIVQITSWVEETICEVLASSRYDIKAINCSAYGASLVYIDENGECIAPLYNYLKPVSKHLQDTFYGQYGGEAKISVETASPVLGSLNSGLQLYRLKYEKPELYKRIEYALHLPQYISWLITRQPASEITSIGCHTALWNFKYRMYHDWVYEEELDQKFAPVLRSGATMNVERDGRTLKAGIGLHDSSAALIPYLACFSEPFILVSTGTWCISLNPFNEEPLTEQELARDCLCYLEYHGRPVKSSRLFAGEEHGRQVKLLAVRFNVDQSHYQNISFNATLSARAKERASQYPVMTGTHPSAFSERDPGDFSSYEEAYHQLMADIVAQQKTAISLVLSPQKITRIFVDGGFANNSVFMHMLADAFPSMQVFAASVSQAAAIGAALAIHHEWNTQPVPADLVALKYYPV